MHSDDLQHVGIWGRSLSGKTTQAKLILARRGRLIVFDPLDEYAEVAPIRATSIREVVAAIRAGWPHTGRVRYVPERKVDMPAALDLMTDILIETQDPLRPDADRFPITLAVDEMAAAAPNVRRLSKGFVQACQRGRHWGVFLVGLSQRMAEVTTTFRGNTMVDYFFPPRGAADRDAALALIGREHKAALMALKAHEFLVYRDGEIASGKNPPIR